MNRIESVYLDNHATTRVDPLVVQAMLPFFTEHFGNAGSVTHHYGEFARIAVQKARDRIAQAIGAESREIVFTSGATESNNLALRGVAESKRRRGNHIVSVVTEHRAILDPLKKLSRRGYEVTWLPVEQITDSKPGGIDLNQLEDALRDDTCLVTIMLANNEIGTIQPLAEAARICHARDILFHSDATQGVGKLPLTVDDLGVDLMSFTAHKVYGPKGIGALYLRKRERRIRLESQIDGGGQEHGIRSGTLNVPGIVGFAKAIELCGQRLDEESQRLVALRNRLFNQLQEACPDLVLNGPPLDDSKQRLAGNLNVQFPTVDGEALMIQVPQLAMSSGSACTSTDPDPSHVLRAIGLSEDQVRSSLRFGLGRFNDEHQVDWAAERLGDALRRLHRFT